MICPLHQQTLSVFNFLLQCMVNAWETHSSFIINAQMSGSLSCIFYIDAMCYAYFSLLWVKKNGRCVIGNQDETIMSPLLEMKR